MTKEHLARLKTYLALLTARLEAPTPQKHIEHPDTFRRFLLNEISIVNTALENAKQESIGGGK